MLEQTEYWEPWIPQEGDRVTLRLSGECPACCNQCQASLHHSKKGGWQGTLFVREVHRGETIFCSLVPCRGRHSIGGHYYWVSPNPTGSPFDQPWQLCAAIELELIEEA